MTNVTSFRMEALQSRGSGKWITDLNGPSFNLAALCLEQEPADILCTDIKNLCYVGDRYTCSDRKDRQMRIKCFHGDVETLTSDKFVPHGKEMMEGTVHVDRLWVVRR